MSKPLITVLFGGVGEERPISLITGRCLAEALETEFPVNRVELASADLPDGLDPRRTIIYPALHGEFGEDGQVQARMEARGFTYCGSDAASSRLCIHKSRSKTRVASAGVTVIPGLSFRAPDETPTGEAVVNELGPDLVIKPENKGSSVGLHLPETRDDLASILSTLEPGEWVVEQRVRGRELSIAVIDGKGMGIVELLPRGGVYDYTAKYTAGQTEYRFPAELEEGVEARVREAAETAFRECGCRDFARVDFMLSNTGEPLFLEINTLPGLTPTSLLPKSASVFGFSFESVIKELVRPALYRFNSVAEAT
jgi:D-alanine-D-alanine ligase